MKTPYIPKGWRRLGPRAILRRGDRWKNEMSFRWSDTTRIGQTAKVPGNVYTRKGK